MVYREILVNLDNGYMVFHLPKVSYDFSVGLNFQNKKSEENKMRRFRLEKRRNFKNCHEG